MDYLIAREAYGDRQRYGSVLDGSQHRLHRTPLVFTYDFSYAPYVKAPVYAPSLLRRGGSASGASGGSVRNFERAAFEKHVFGQRKSGDEGEFRRFVEEANIAYPELGFVPVQKTDYFIPVHVSKKQNAG